MKLSPIQGAIETVRLLLSNSLKMKSSQEGESAIPPFISPLPPQYQAPPDLPGAGTLPPILTDPGSGGILGPFNPIGPYNPNAGGPQNPNEIPQDISDLLGGR